MHIIAKGTNPAQTKKKIQYALVDVLKQNKDKLIISLGESSSTEGVISMYAARIIKNESGKDGLDWYQCQFALYSKNDTGQLGWRFRGENEGYTECPPGKFAKLSDGERASLAKSLNKAVQKRLEEDFGIHDDDSYIQITPIKKNSELSFTNQAVKKNYETLNGSKDYPKSYGDPNELFKPGYVFAKGKNPEETKKNIHEILKQVASKTTVWLLHESFEQDGMITLSMCHGESDEIQSESFALYLKEQSGELEWKLWRDSGYKGYQEKPEAFFGLDKIEQNVLADSFNTSLEAVLREYGLNKESWKVYHITPKNIYHFWENKRPLKKESMSLLKELETANGVGKMLGNPNELFREVYVFAPGSNPEKSRKGFEEMLKSVSENSGNNPVWMLCESVSNNGGISVLSWVPGNDAIEQNELSLYKVPNTGNYEWKERKESGYEGWEECSDETHNEMDTNSMVVGAKQNKLSDKSEYKLGDSLNECVQKVLKEKCSIVAQDEDSYTQLTPRNVSEKNMQKLLSEESKAFLVNHRGSRHFNEVCGRPNEMLKENPTQTKRYELEFQRRK